MRKVKNWPLSASAETILQMQELGQQLKNARKRRKMTVSELANRAGVDRRTISHLEEGHPGVSLGVFVQVLSLLNLTGGLAEALKPENDMEAIAMELRKVRSQGRLTKKISDDEVDF